MSPACGRAWPSQDRKTTYVRVNDYYNQFVVGPEAFDPDSYLALLDRYGIHHAMVEMEPGAHRPT